MPFEGLGQSLFDEGRAKARIENIQNMLKHGFSKESILDLGYTKKEYQEARQDQGKVLTRRDKLTDKADRSYFELEAAAISQHIYISDYIRGLIVSALDGKLPADQIEYILDEVDKLQFRIIEEIEGEDERIKAIADVLEHEYNLEARTKCKITSGI